MNYLSQPNAGFLFITSQLFSGRVTQRFYFFQGLTGITVEEAYRFLQNRWLEKQMLAKRKQEDNSQVEEAGNDSQVSSGSGLLVKKRLNNVKRPKRQQK